MANLPALNDDNFTAEVDQADLPVLVDFGAEWCGPCRALAPTVEKLAADYEGKLKVGYVDIDKAQKTAMRFMITSVPTLLFFKGGEVVEKVTGLQPEATLRTKIDGILA